MKEYEIAYNNNNKFYYLKIYQDNELKKLIALFSERKNKKRKEFLSNILAKISNVISDDNVIFNIMMQFEQKY